MSIRAVLWLLRITIILWRFDAMYKQTMSVAKGVGMGLLAGAAVAVIGTKAMGGRRSNMKKNASKAIHTVGKLIGDVEKMMR